MTQEFCFATSENIEDKLPCLSSAVNIIGTTIDPDIVKSACQGLVISAKEYCETYAENEGNLPQVLDVLHEL